MRAILLVAALVLSACATSSAAPRTAGDVFRDCRDCPQMVAIPGGQFMMSGDDFEDGSRRPIQRVSVQDFAIGRYEVTFNEWDACVRGGGCASNPNPEDQGWGRGRRPVINVSWNDALEYVQWLSAHTGQNYRLPSEAEWEYADEYPNRSVGWWTPPSALAGERTAPVGSHQPNYFGVHDKGGNVSEWAEDAWRDSFNDAPVNGSDSLTTTDQRVGLGANWQDSWSRRNSAPADERMATMGFRVALSLAGVRNPNPLPPPLSGPPEPPMEGGYYVLDGGCGDYQSPMTLRRSTTLHASRDSAAPVVATARGGDNVTIIECRVHLRPRRGEVLRTDHGFEAGRPVYYLHNNTPEMYTSSYFEHDMLVEYHWHQGEIIALGYEDLTQDMFNWEQADQPRESAGGGCWYLLEARGVRGWSQSADIDCFWTGRSENSGAPGLDGRHPRLAYTLRAGDYIVDAAFSPDGSRIITVSNDGERAWDAQSGAPVAAAPSTGMSSVTIQDGAAIVRTADGRLVASVRDDESLFVSEAILVADGARLATLSDHQTASLWDVATGSRLFVFGGVFRTLGSFSYFPDGARIVTWGGAAGGDAEAEEPTRIWNAANGRLLHTLQRTVVTPAFSPNRRQFAIVGWDNVTIFNTRTGRAVRAVTYDVYQESVHSVAFSPDGTKVLTSDPWNTASVWDIATGELVLRLDPFDAEIPGVEPGEGGVVSHASFSPDGTRILTVGRGVAQVWDLTRSAFVYQ